MESGPYCLHLNMLTHQFLCIVCQREHTSHSSHTLLLCYMCLILPLYDKVASDPETRPHYNAPLLKHLSSPLLSSLHYDLLLLLFS